MPFSERQLEGCIKRRIENSYDQLDKQKDSSRYAGKICDSCNHDIECTDCDSYVCFKRNCPVSFNGCTEILGPFLGRIYEIIELRDAQFPWWADDITAAEFLGIIIHGRASTKCKAERQNINQDGKP